MNKKVLSANCLNCNKVYKNYKINSCCGKFRYRKCCDNPIQDTKENREKKLNVDNGGVSNE